MPLVTTLFLLVLFLFFVVICGFAFLQTGEQYKTRVYQKTKSKGKRVQQDKPIYVKEQLQILQSRSSWGESQTITLFELAYKQPVHVWEIRKNGLLNESENFQPLNKHKKAPLNILFNGFNHYDFLKPARDGKDSFDVIKCRPDGNCLFHALAKGLQHTNDPRFRDSSYTTVKKRLLWYLTSEKGEKQFRNVIDNQYRALSGTAETKKNEK